MSWGNITDEDIERELKHYPRPFGINRAGDIMRHLVSERASLRSQLARSEEVRKQLAGALRECAGFFDGPASADRRGFEGLCEAALAASDALDKAPPFDPPTMPHDHDHLDNK